MMKKILIIPLILIFNYSFSQTNEICGSKVIIDQMLYQEAEEGEFEFVNIEMESNCLKLMMRYAGGCKDPEVKLIDADIIKESYPPQRVLKLTFKSNDNCEALITQDFYFDLTNLKVNSEGGLILNIKHWKKRILFEY